MPEGTGCAMYGYSDVSKSGEFPLGIRELPKEEKLQLFNVNKALVNEVGFSEDELCELVLKDRELIAKINNPSEKVPETLVTNMPGSRTIELIGVAREKHVAIGIDAARELGMPVEWDNDIDGEDAGDL